MIDGQIDSLWAFLVWLAASGGLLHRLTLRVRAAKRALASVPASERQAREDLVFRDNTLASFRTSGLSALIWLLLDWLY
jgi:hypothetical protein